MKAVIQRVKEASVEIERQVVGSIGIGIVVLLGVEKQDTEKQADWLLNKIIDLRVFPDREGKMNLSLKDIKGGLLIVSQFTLLGDCRKGRRPSFDKAGDPQEAKKLYEYFVDRAKKQIDLVGEGQFAAMMDVKLINDGPVTLILETP